MYKIFKLKCIYYFFSKMENINNKLKLKIIKLFFHYQGDSMKFEKKALKSYDFRGPKNVCNDACR